MNITIRKIVSVLPLVLPILLGTHAAFADQLSEIKARGTLICGVLGTIPPFSFQDAQTRETIGYDVEMCKLVARHLNVKPELKVISAGARVPEVNQGRIDIVAGALGWTPARAEQIDYSDAYFKTQTVLAFPATSKYTSWSQFTGKRIGAGTATTSAQAVRDKIPQANLITFDDTAQVLLALRQEKIDAIALNEIFLQKYKKESQKTPSAIEVLSNPPLFSETYGLGVKKGEQTLLSAVNDALVQGDHDGEIDKAFDEYLGKNSEYGMTRHFTIEKIAP
jgi:polar amino acid transport system substrate-binding protein